MDEIFNPLAQILSIVYVYDKMSAAWLSAKLNAFIQEVLCSLFQPFLDIKSR